MRNFFAIALCCLASALALPAAAQSTTPPNFEQAPPQVPNLLTGVQAYQLLTSQVFGFDPIVAANIVLRSEAAYGAYFSLNQLLAVLPDESN